MNKVSCYHCGAPQEGYKIGDKNFCCLGCLNIYEIIHNHNLDKFYELNLTPGIIPDKKALYKYDFIDEEKIREKLIEFEEGSSTLISFFIPSIHCSSCIWLLEHLPDINPDIIQSRVNFSKKTLQVLFNNEKKKLSEIAKFLAKIGYRPSLNLDSTEKKKQKSNNTLLYKLAISFFCFGNIMLLAFPEYIGAQGDPFLEENQNFFRGLMFFLSLPVLFFCASDYLLSAYKAIQNKFMNIDVPISIGILTLFFRSLYEIISKEGPGYFDGFSGIVFFMLSSRYFQIKTYSFLDFDRDYKSFYPIAALAIKQGKEKVFLLSELKKGDHILIRNEEIIPCDCILIKGNAKIDNSFISGESKLITKKIGDKIYAGGKQKGERIELEIVKEVEQSYLRGLWNNEVFKKKESLETLINKISKYFTPIILSISFLSFIYWFSRDNSKAFQAFCAVLIVACPCVLSLSVPFTLGNLMRIFAKWGFFLKEAQVIEKISKINSIVFDKTGTLTKNENQEISFLGNPLNQKQKKFILALVKNSRHPLSKLIYKHLTLELHSNVFEENKTPYKENRISLCGFREIPGKGLKAFIEGTEIKIGSAIFLEVPQKMKNKNQTQVFVSFDNKPFGYFQFSNSYREGISGLLEKLKKYKLFLLSGDNDGEKIYLEKLFGKENKVLFNQSPQNKLDFIKNLQKEGDQIMMLGDGLNDAGALKQSQVGVAIFEDVNSFSPNCEVLMKGFALKKLYLFLKLSKIGMRLVKINFVISIFYNLIGLSFAIGGNLSPLIAAILMPASSISVILFGVLSTWLVSYLIKNNFS